MTMDLSQLAGPFGGIFAAGIGVGLGLMWKFADKNIVVKLEKQIADLRVEMTGEREDCQRQLDEQRNIRAADREDYSRQIAGMARRMKDFEDLAINGIKRQFQQLRQSGENLLLDQHTHDGNGETAIRDLGGEKPQG